MHFQFLQVNGCVIFEYLPGGRGMEAAPSNGELHMANVWRSRSGLIRVEHDYALPAMELPFEPLKTVKKNPDSKDSPIISFILPHESWGFTSSFYFTFVHGRFCPDRGLVMFLQSL